MESTKLLFAPGPIRTPKVVKEMLRNDPPYFTTKRFSDLLKHIQPKLQYVFGTDRPVLIGTGSGSLGMESCVSNFFSKGDRVLVISNGKYGENWIKMCSAYKLKVNILSGRIGYPPTRQSLDIVLSRKVKLDGIFITHTETTTAVVSPLEMYRKLIRRKSPNSLIIVDAVSSLLTEKLDACDYDVVISASQKALALPAGLFFMTFSEYAESKARKSNLPKFYFDVLNELERCSKNITTFTPASYIIPALDVALTYIEAATKESIIDNTMSHSMYVRRELQPYFKLFTTHHCNAVTSFNCEGSNRFIKIAEEEGLILGAGVRMFNNLMFRIMHFGWDTYLKEVVQAVDIIKRIAGTKYGRAYVDTKAI